MLPSPALRNSWIENTYLYVEFPVKLDVDLQSQTGGTHAIYGSFTLKTEERNKTNDVVPV